MNAQRLFLRFFLVLFWAIVILLFICFPKFYTKKNDKILNIFSWPAIFDLNYISKFEHEHNVTVNINYYESNEELLVKLKATRGVGYDIIVPSDYAVNILTAENFLKPIDKSKLNFYSNLNPIILNQYFDSGNIYSIPFEWSVFGVAYLNSFAKHISNYNTWDMIFENNMSETSNSRTFDSPCGLAQCERIGVQSCPLFTQNERKGMNCDYKILMPNDPLLSIPLASLYLFNKTVSLTAQELEKIKEVLIKQKQWVQAYTDVRVDYILFLKNCPLAVTSSAYISRLMLNNSNKIGFYVPDFSLVTIESIVIPKNTKNDELIYKFLNFIYSSESIIHHVGLNAFFPATVSELDYLNLPKAVKPILKISKDQFSKLNFFKPDLFIKNDDVEGILRDLWIKVKSN